MQLIDDQDLAEILDDVGEIFTLPGGAEVCGRFTHPSVETLEFRTRRPGATFRRSDVQYLDIDDVIVRSSTNVCYTLVDREPGEVDALERLVLEERP